MQSLYSIAVAKTIDKDRARRLAPTPIVKFFLDLQPCLVLPLTEDYRSSISRYQRKYRMYLIWYLFLN
jgi:hypothetical protein